MRKVGEDAAHVAEERIGVKEFIPMLLLSVALLN
jgi:hypothetical protein